jgi:heme a synthase
VRQAVGYRHAHDDSARVPLPPGTWWLLAATFAALWLQVALGGWVSTNYAVLACQQFPTCQGTWWPEMDFRQAFELWRPLGMTSGGEHIAFSALTAIHYAHRLAAYVVFVLLGATAWQLRAPLPRHGRLVAALALWQLASGLSNVVLGWPMLGALAHTGGAAALVIVLTWALCEAQLSASPRAIARPVQQGVRT